MSVVPGAGAVRAYYGGRQGLGGLDYADSVAGRRRRKPGSSFKPYVLATALSRASR